MPYYNPYSLQPLYEGAIPTIVNISLINSLNHNVVIKKVEWHSITSTASAIEVSLAKESHLLPYFGHLGLVIRIIPGEISNNLHSILEVRGNIKVFLEAKEEGAGLESGNSKEDDELEKDYFNILCNFEVTATPPREKRILWDQFHNLNFPDAGYIPRDSLINFDYPYDWLGDSPFVNFLWMYQVLRENGYFLEILRGSFECFDAINYGMLLIVDPEEKFSESEIQKLEKDIMMKGLSVTIFADWFD